MKHEAKKKLAIKKHHTHRSIHSMLRDDYEKRKKPHVLYVLGAIIISLTFFAFFTEEVILRQYYARQDEGYIGIPKYFYVFPVSISILFFFLAGKHKRDIERQERLGNITYSKIRDTI